MKTPFVKRLNAGGSAAQLGTTFPPRGHMYPLGETKLFGRRDTFHSEPDLSPLAAYSGRNTFVLMYILDSDFVSKVNNSCGVWMEFLAFYFIC